MSIQARGRDVSTFQPERSADNDPDLWPGGAGPGAAWRIGPHPALADVGWEWIRPDLLAEYRRTAAGDAALLDYFERTGERDPRTGNLVPRTLRDPDNLLHRNGLPIVADLSNPEGREMAFHYEALRQAKHRIDQRRHTQVQRANDRHLFTCHSCGAWDRDTVRLRAVGAWEQDRRSLEMASMRPGPRLCDRCDAVAWLLIDEQRRAAGQAAAAMALPDGRSVRDAVGAFLNANRQRIMGE